MLLQVQTWALSGGPQYTSLANISDVTGSFAGVLTPIGLAPGATAIGVFTLVVPKAGQATGAFNYFITGSVFVGTMTGVGDPKGTKIVAFLTATATLDQYLTTVNFVGNPPLPVFTSRLATVSSGNAAGSLRATVRSVNGSKATADIGAVGARLSGNASLTVVRAPAPPGGNQNGFPPDGETLFKVSGYRQLLAP